jgi:hypothetical protein
MEEVSFIGPSPCGRENERVRVTDEQTKLTDERTKHQGKITLAPRCLGTMLNTYKIHDVLYIRRGMYDLNIPSRHKWGMYTLGMLFFGIYT